MHYRRNSHNVNLVDCTEHVEIPSTIGGVSVTAVGDNAFYGPNYIVGDEIRSVVIPDSVVMIGGGAFAENYLTSVTIGNSVQAINEYAFAYNQLSAVAVPASVASIADDAFGHNGITYDDDGNFTGAFYVKLYAEGSGLSGGTAFECTEYDDEWVDCPSVISAGGHLINPAQVTVQYHLYNTPC